jgi:O-antigen ligase
MPARWVVLALLLAVAVARAVLCLPAWRFPPLPGVALGAFCGLGLVSIAWSVHRPGTVQRVVGEVVVIGSLGLLAGCAAARPVLRARLLDAVLFAAAIVAFAGFLYWLVEPERGVLAATVEYPSRYQGIEENPNTAALLLAMGMPLALARSLGAAGTAARVGFAALVLVFAASISASGSRGGLLAGFLALLVVAALARLDLRVRAGVAAGVVAALVVSAWAMTVPQALPVGSASSPPPVTRNAELVLRLSQEIGNPWWTKGSGAVRRSLFSTSVRLRALRGTVRRALERPLLGYGFGAEQWAFVNRYYGFSSGNPENGYAGLFLQLGLVGLALFLVAVGSCLVYGVRACLRPVRGDALAVAAVGASVAGLAMGLSQSFFHGPGGIGYVALWTSLLVAAAGVREPA